MKIGILTFHYAHNYGAVLQAYALRTYLEELGHNVKILDYRSENIVRMYPKRVKAAFPKRYIFHPSKWRDIQIEFEKCRYSRESWKCQYSKFENFIMCYLVKEQEDNWLVEIENCDVVFFGSDQIWEENIVGSAEKTYFGDFETRAIKASYAASCFDAKRFSDSSKVALLENFDYISVRESALADYLQGKIKGKEVCTVVDPVLLLKKKYYENIADFKDENYILFYFVSENDELAKISEHLRLKEKKKVIEIHYFRNKKICHEWQLADVGPQEFVGLMMNATEVYTNSFHGTALSIVFSKNFWTISKNVRIIDLLERLNLDKRRIENLAEWNEKKSKEENIWIEAGALNDIVGDSEKYISKVLEKAYEKAITR